MMPTESLLTKGEWLPGELLDGSERRTPGWFIDMNIRLVLYERKPTEKGLVTLESIRLLAMT